MMVFNGRAVPLDECYHVSSLELCSHVPCGIQMTVSIDIAAELGYLGILTETPAPNLPVTSNLPMLGNCDTSVRLNWH